MEPTTPPPKHPTTAITRSGDLDAARGAAMVFTCLSHFAAAYFKLLGDVHAGAWLVGIAKVASPTFMMLSGLLVGWRYRLAPAQFARFRGHLMDRAFFLLTIGHILIQASQLRRLTFLGEVPDFLVMTDVIAVACIIGPVLVVRLGARARLALGLTLFVVTWALILGWTPQGELAREFKASFLGLRGSEPGIGGNCVAVLPWLSVYIAGSWLGHVLAGRRRDDGGVLVPAVLWRLGATLGVVAVALRLGAIALTRGRGAGIEGEAVTMLTSPWQKMPPGPDYVLFFGAAGLCMAAAVTQLRALRAGRVVTGWLETLGRNSAVVFIVQFYVYALILPLAFPFVPGLSAAVWPVAFVATVASLVLFAREWEARRLNRLLTVQPMLRLLPADRSRTALAMGVAALLLVLTARLNTLVKASPLLPHGRASAHVHTTASLRS